MVKVVQIHIAVSIARHWKVRRSERPGRSVQAFWAANLALCIGYVVSALLALASFSIKLDLVRYVSEPLYENGKISCPQGFVLFHMALCVVQGAEQKAGPSIRTLDGMELMNSVLVHCVFIASDVLLVTLSLTVQLFVRLLALYRCIAVI
jgi:hypothetical protein